MDEPISARYLWEPDALADALAAHQRHSLRPVFRVLLFLLFLLSSAIFIGLPLSIICSPDAPPEARRNSAIFLFIYSLLGAWAIVGARTRWFLRWRARRAFRLNPNALGFVEWSIDADQLISRTPLSASTILWPLFTKVVESPKGFMLYQSSQFFNWIPGHAFASATELRRLADLARSRVAKYVVLGECRHVGKPEPPALDEL